MKLCIGSCSLQGTSRKRNEDRYTISVSEEATDVGEPFAYAGVFDGHGGDATASWLVDKLADFVEKHWESGGEQPELDIREAFVKADRRLLAPKGGFFGGMGERGVGGSKCGATAAVALLFPGPRGATQLLAANVGDARVLLCRKGEALQLTVDHVPDSELERKRIERTNPNPKMPLVRYVGGTWRVGGILALSRAFGDAYLKGSLQYEGVRAGDNYSSGFGVIAEPDTSLTALTPEDSLVLIASDGLFANKERGGGGGLSNQEAVELAGRVGDPEDAARQLARAAQDAGSTDDVTVVVLRLE
ncbi:hypothetical protein WJX81_007509 [Elliptochloris bilobata]|uniref:protein-serine/threonine phosphatase n=1 Tax=Elliptochloris bilobata TaxID=381761 RepID=A0AAW1SHN8_9CHLO